MVLQKLSYEMNYIVEQLKIAVAFDHVKGYKKDNKLYKLLSGDAVAVMKVAVLK